MDIPPPVGALSYARRSPRGSLQRRPSNPAHGRRGTLWRNLALVGLLYIFVLTWVGYAANPAL